MTKPVIWIQNKKYYRQGLYRDWKEADKAKKKYKKKGYKYFIIKYEKQGFLDIVPEVWIALYLNKPTKIF